MTIQLNRSLFDDVFEIVQQTIKTHPKTQMLDPIADLLAKPIVQIPYVRKPMNNASSAFMTIKKSHKNWIGLLLGDLKNFKLGAQADFLVMQSQAGARSSQKQSKQTWDEFVHELHRDKINQRNDISEAQARQLVRLIDELSANGFKLKGCGKLSFIDENDNVL